MTWLVMLLACGDKDGTDPVDSTPDSEAEDSDPGDSTACASEDLVFAVTVGDAAGPCTDACASPVDVGGMVRNMGGAACTLETTSSCLVGRATAGPSDGGGGPDVRASCDDAITSWTIEAGGNVMEIVIEDATLSPGSYKAQAFFENSDQTVAVGGFDVAAK